MLTKFESELLKRVDSLIRRHELSDMTKSELVDFLYDIKQDLEAIHEDGDKALYDRDLLVSDPYPY